MDRLGARCGVFTLVLLVFFVDFSSRTVQQDYCTHHVNLTFSACQTIELLGQQDAMVPLDNITYLPNIFGHETMAQAVAGYHDFYPFLQVQCSPHLQQFLCSVLFPRCFPGMSMPFLPCRNFCQRVRDDCTSGVALGVAWPESLNCDRFDEYDSDSFCFDPLLGEDEDDEGNDSEGEDSSKVTPTPTVIHPEPSQRCQPLPNDPICQAMSYSTVIFPNIAGQQNPTEALVELHKYSVFMSEGRQCSDLLRSYLCLAYLPPCKIIEDVTVPIPPCRSLCQQVLTKSCLSVIDIFRMKLPPSVTDCSVYPTQSDSYPTCLMPGVHYDPLVSPLPPTVLPGLYSFQCDEDGCVDVLHAKCHSLWYPMTNFPTALGYTTMQEAVDDLDSLASLIDSGCSKELQLFACIGALHPTSLGQHSLWPLPCRSVCEDVWKSCRTKAEELLEKRPRLMQCHLYPTKDCDSDMKRPQEPVTILNASRVNLTHGIVEFIKEVGYVTYDKISRKSFSRDTYWDIEMYDTGPKKIYIKLYDTAGCHVVLWPLNAHGLGAQPSAVWIPPYVIEALPEHCEPADIMHCSRLGYDTVVHLHGRWQWDPPYRLLTEWQDYFSEELLESGDGCLSRLHELLCAIVTPPCPTQSQSLRYPCQEFCKSVQSACKASSIMDELDWLLETLPCSYFRHETDSSCIREFDWMTSEASLHRNAHAGYFEAGVRVYCLVEEETPESPPEFYGPDGKLIPPTLPSDRSLSGRRVIPLSPRMTILYFDKVPLEDAGTYACKSAGGTLPRTTVITPPLRCPPSLNHTLCAPFVRTGFVQSPNVFGHTSQYQALVSSYHFLPLLSTKCSSDLLELVCAFYAPECEAGSGTMQEINLPSQRLCRNVKSACAEATASIGFKWPSEINCDKLPSYDDQPEEQMGSTKKDCIKLRRYDIIDKGIDRLFYGWADVQGQGAANDYCRVVSIGQFKMLSCALAGTQGQSQYNYNSPNPENWLDLGHTDTWYMKDKDGDGRDDYCRCVGAAAGTHMSCLRAGYEGFEDEFEPEGITYEDCQYIKVNKIFGPSDQQ
ncbi:uncharacterized protein LOC110984961 [Acanthaster planci]|uniref:Uncharacterized protein LOC110984961 n=1 Tax=Acanthaster planci TaxID=133434 RepID=A0A8B7ZDP3_ACAPL|nr:uncharacterized protein LOC110984961 [Acanthaster planci]